MDDDRFERALLREQEIRERLDAGQIDEREAEELRHLAGAAGRPGHASDSRIRLSVDQVARIADEEVDVEVIRILLDSDPALDAESAIDLASDHGLEASQVRELVGAVSRGVSADQLVELLDHDIDSTLLREVAVYGFDDPVEAAVELTDHIDDPVPFMRRLRERGLEGLSVDEICELADHDVDPDLLREVAAYGLDDPVEAAVELIDHLDDPTTFLRRLREGGFAGLSVDDACEMADHEVDPDLLHEASLYGLDDPVRAALELADHLDRPSKFLRELRDLGLEGLTVEEVCEMADHAVKPSALRAMLDADPSLELQTAIGLCREGVEARTVARLRDEGVEIDVHRLARPKTQVSLLNLGLGGHRVVIGAGHHTVSRDGTVTGLVIGDLTVLPGVHAAITATVVGNLHIEPGADVVLRGRVTGRIDNRGVLHGVHSEV